ncbi:MAG: hypothetical protein RL240_1237 [Planctomycetota bacterium]
MRTVSSRCGRLTQRPYSDSLNSRVRNRIGLAAIAWGGLAVAVPQMPLSGHRVFADGPADNKVENIRPIPPLGIEVPAEVRESLVQGLASLQQAVEELRKDKHPRVQAYLPDVEIFSRAVEIALNENGFFETADFDRAKELIAEGLRRSQAISNEQFKTGVPVPYWASLDLATGRLTVRGFRSKLDGSVQPYGVVAGSGAASGRADVWCRGRSEKGLELQFLSTRMKSRDPIPSDGVLMIHPFGRYCNANKLAGEIDTIEAIEHAVGQYSIDPQRIAIRGFSMGGAAAWHLAVHYPDRWFAATPGAGFSETPEFLKVFQSEELKPYWFEEKLWQLYDCPVWVRNIRMLPTIAYSGEIDKQKQAADIMAHSSWNLPKEDRFELTHIVAPNTAHSISAEAKQEIERRLKLLDPGSEPTELPTDFTLTTTTLRYNRAHWISIDALKEHWVPTSIRVNTSLYLDKKLTGTQSFGIRVEPDPGVTQFTIDLPVKAWEPAPVMHVEIFQGGNQVGEEYVKRSSDRSFRATFRADGSKWTLVSPVEVPSKGLRKRAGLQGPIDDALLGPFLFVRPSAQGWHSETDQWVQSEFDRAVKEWHRQMRGDVRIKTSEELTASDIQNFNLILWGDPKSNPTIAKVLNVDGVLSGEGKLPIEWSEDSVAIGQNAKRSSKGHIPLLVYPNPLAPTRYVVFNSSFTYREYDYLNNARQVPKLPDWAVIDLATPPNGRWPGGIAEADFFDESWQVRPPQVR